MRCHHIPAMFLTLLFGVPGQAAEPAKLSLAGTWKVVRLGSERQALWLVRFEEKAGQWTGIAEGNAPGVFPVKLENLQLTPQRLRFDLKAAATMFHLEAPLSKAGPDRVLGNLASGTGLMAIRLERTQLKTLNPVDVAREMLDKESENPQTFDVVVDGLLGQASAQKLSARDVSDLAEKAYANAATYGQRWQRAIAVRIAEALMDQPDFVKLAVDYASNAQKLLEPSDDPNAQIAVLETLANGLRKLNRAAEAKDVESRIAKLEAQADENYRKNFPTVKADKYAGRKKPGTRAVLVELFTGAQCPPCVAADMAFDALAKTYQPSEVVLLEYHLHIPGPDALTNPHTEDRAKYYEPLIEGTPTVLFNGKPGAEGGGPVAAGAPKYRDYRRVVDPLLETPAKLQIKADATQKGETIDIHATVSGLTDNPDRLRLRFVLVQEEVRYPGSNGIRFHHHVVRGFPAGSQGLRLKGKSDEHATKVDLASLSKDLSKYLDEVAKEKGFPDNRRPLTLDNLLVVAFVQDDMTKEVLQAVQVPVKK